MDSDQKIQLLTEWGQWMNSTDRVDHWIHEAARRNPWFHPPFVRQMIQGFVSQYLDQDLLRKWLSKYSFSGSSRLSLGVICAGNLPAVGFHDVLCVLSSPHNLQLKLSSKDDYLLPEFLRFFDGTEWEQRISIVDRLKNFDAVIATGSESGMSYFEQYFGKYPHLFRGHRNGIAIIKGNESVHDLENLGKDIFEFYGLGCRSVSLIATPKGWDIRPALKIWEEQYSELAQNHKYMNNYDYNKAILLLNKVDHLSSNNLHVVSSDSMHSKISVLHKMEYDDEKQLKKWISDHQEGIQCIVSNGVNGANTTYPFGHAQSPWLEDYADGKDTMQFLSNLTG